MFSFGRLSLIGSLLWQLEPPLAENEVLENGGRDADSEEVVDQVLDLLHPIPLLLK